MSSPARHVLFDVSGLLQWYAYLKHPSGLQRVCEKILQSRPIATSSSVDLIARGPASTCFQRVDRQFVDRLSSAATREAARRSLADAFADSLRRPAAGLLGDLQLMHVPYIALAWGRPWRRAPQSIEPGPNDVVVGLGDFWCHRHHVDRLIALKQRTGCALVHMVHDLFALERREWTHPYFGPLFRQSLERLSGHVDRWLVNSRFVGNSLAAFAGSTAQIDVVPMGWSTLGEGSDDHAVLARRGLTAKGYILHVGTLEPRKNIGALLDAIEQISAPLLVLVGRDGWRATDIRQRIARAGAHVRWIPDASDSELPALYRGARFTVVPSLGEGWGLPVQESLALGVPVIAARAGALPEVGGDLARYVEPGDTAALAAAIADWSRNDNAVTAARVAIRRRLASPPPLPTWDDAGAVVLDAALNARSSVSA